MQVDPIRIEQVTYTASLVSRPEEIDTLLDPLRTITARLDSSAALTRKDQEALAAIQEKLETYLVTNEKLRSFTRESLRLQIEQHMAGSQSRASLVQLWVVITVAFIFAVIAASLPFVQTAPERIQVAGATAFSFLTVGAASLFLTALPAFKSALRQRFLLICAGVTLLGLSLLGQPIMEVFHLRQYPLVSVLYSLPILLAAILFHAGNASYVRLIGVRNYWTTAKPLIIIGIPLTIFTCIVPHPHTSEPEIIHDLVACIWAWILLTPTASAIIFPAAIKRLPDLYKPPVRLLFFAMFAIIAVVLYQYILRLVAGPYMEGPVAYILFSLVIIMGLTLLRAGYAFHKVSRY